MTHIIWSNTDVADYGLVIPDYFSEILECLEIRFGLSPQCFCVSHMTVQMLHYVYSQSAHILRNTSFMYLGSKSEMIAVIMGVQYSRTTFQKLVHILGNIIFVFGRSIAFREIMPKVNQNSGA